MFCNACGAQNPPDARFCYKCGKPLGESGSAPAPPPPGAAPAAPKAEGPQNLTCKTCGAPLRPMGGDMVVTCEYCGSSVAMSSDGWKAIKTHSMLVPKVVDEQEALGACREWMDRGLLHHHLYEESKLIEGKLSMVPYWIVPVSAVTHYTYEDIAVQGAEIGGSIAAAALVGSLLGGGGRGRGGMFVAPVFMGGGGSARRAAELSGQYDYPVIAVQGLQSYQPKDYQFDLLSRIPFEKRRLPSGYPILNGDIGEEAAKYMARNFVVALQGDKAHKAHRMVQSLKTEVDVADGELLHVPIWYFTFDHKGDRTILLVDGAKMQVMNSVQ